MTSRAIEYFKMAANGAGAALGGLITAAGAYQATMLSTPEEKLGGALVMTFLAAAEYKFVHDTVRHYRAARNVEPGPANDN